MNRRILHQLNQIPLRLRGLQAPESRQGASENVLRADGIGIGGVTTMPTQKYLSLAVVLVHRTTLDKSGPDWPNRRGKLNTVHLGEFGDPGESVPVGPRCTCLIL